MANCSEEDKIVYATFQMSGTAEEWWDEAKRHMEANEVTLTWTNFKKVVLDKYLDLQNPKGTRILGVETREYGGC